MYVFATIFIWDPDEEKPFIVRYRDELEKDIPEEWWFGESADRTKKMTINSISEEYKSSFFNKIEQGIVDFLLHFSFRYQKVFVSFYFN